MHCQRPRPMFSLHAHCCYFANVWAEEGVFIQRLEACTLQFISMFATKRGFFSHNSLCKRLLEWVQGRILTLLE